MESSNNDLGSSFAVVGGTDAAYSGTTNAPNPILTNDLTNIRLNLPNRANETPIGGSNATVGIQHSVTKKEYRQTIEFAKAVASLWQSQPETVMPSPGPGIMPSLTESASQSGMKNGDGCYTGWQSYSTFSFLRYRVLGWREWEWNICASTGLGSNINVVPPVALNSDVVGGSTRTNVTATPYDDETGAMLWVPDRLQRQPAHWYDEDVFLRLLLLERNELRLRPQTIKTDLELGSINASESEFPDSRNKVCFFHLSQCIWRKILATGLAARYGGDEDSSLKMRHLSALAFLPANEMPCAFEERKAHLPDEAREVINWFEGNYVHGRIRTRLRNGFVSRSPVLFPPSLWKTAMFIYSCNYDYTAIEFCSKEICVIIVTLANEYDSVKHVI
uniref:MULE transposase domain-containing protein n=1 Tax=Trichuris muris TaxID=70415 RepID=A0A5S6QSP4_TRIMR